MQFLPNGLASKVKRLFEPQKQYKNYYEVQLCTRYHRDGYLDVEGNYGKCRAFWGPVLHEQETWYVVRIFFEHYNDYAEFVFSYNGTSNNR